MYITYRDELGLVLVEVDEYGIGFVDGLAYFGDGIRDYKIPVSSICEIQIANKQY